jgi:hypothetical protein
MARSRALDHRCPDAGPGYRRQRRHFHGSRDVLLRPLTKCAIAFARGVARYLADVQRRECCRFVVSALVILAAAVIASAVPAARAARVNAVEALRSE